MKQEHCSECGRVLQEGARFCSTCGRPADGQARAQKEPAVGSGHWRRDGLTILGLIIVVVAGYLLMRETPPKVESAEVTGPPGHEEMGATLANMPADYAGLVEGGNQNMDAGNFPMAAEMYRRALAIDGSSPDVRTDFGACLHAMGLPDRALEEFRTVTAEHPEHAIVRFNMGIVHYGQGQLDSARHYWVRYLEVTPHGSAAEAARGYLKELGE